MNLAVLVSGHGSNLEAILKACRRASFPARVVVVVSSNAKAFALQRAAKRRIPAVVAASEARILSILRRYQADWVCLAGFMKILSPGFVRRYRHRILNIHPALLPSFPGLHAQRQAFDHGVKIAGATVHFVDDGCDTGPILLQEPVAVTPKDTAETLRKKILRVEHKIYPEAIRLVATQRLKIVGRRVIKTQKSKWGG